MCRGRRHGPDPARISRWAAQFLPRTRGSVRFESAGTGPAVSAHGARGIRHATVGSNPTVHTLFFHPATRMDGDVKTLAATAPCAHLG
jgi:hypothetical protein